MFSGGMSPDMPTFNSPRDKMRSKTGEALGAGAGARFISAHPESKTAITATAQNKYSFFIFGLPF
jgi:hypothetical protein